MRKRRKQLLAYLLAATLCLPGLSVSSLAADAEGDAALFVGTIADVAPVVPSSAVANVALGKTATAIGEDAGNGYTADKAVDGSDDGKSRWTYEVVNGKSADILNAYWQVDLGTSYDISTMRVLWEDMRNPNDGKFAYTVGYKIETSDTGKDGSWKEAVTKARTDFAVDQAIPLNNPVTARYVRLTCTDHDGYSAISIREFEVYAETELENVALGKTATAKTQEKYTVRPELAVDGDTTDKGSRWGNATNDKPTWFQVDLGRSYDISDVMIYWERHNATNYKIQVSNTGNENDWTDAAVFTQAPTDLAQLVAFDKSCTARYVRLWIESYEADNDGTNWNTVSIYELEVYAPKEPEKDPIIAESGTNLARGKTATASSQEAESVRPALAVDGDTVSGNSRWGSAKSNRPAWLRVDLGDVYQVQRFRIFWERLTVKSHNIEVSVNGSVWEQVYEENTLITQKNESVSLGTPVNARYVRLNIPDYLDQDKAGETIKYDTISLYEFEVYPDNATLPEDLIPESISVEMNQNTLPLPEMSDGYTLEVLGADYEQVIGADGKVYHPIIDTNLTVSLQLTLPKNGKRTYDVPVLVKGGVSANTGNPAPKVIPELREWVGGTGNFTVTDSSRIIYKDEGLAETAQMFAADYKDITGKTIAAEQGDSPSAGDFYLTLGSADAGLGKEGYRMTVGESVSVEAVQQTGAYWATRTILQILKQNGTTIPQGTARDYPKFSVRTLIMDVGRKPFDEQFLDDLLKNMTWYKMNDINLHLSDNYIWLEKYTDAGKDPMTAYSGFRVESSIKGENGHKLTSEDEFYTKDWLRSFIQDARKVGVNIVPEFDTPAHSLALTKTRPDLKKGNSGRENDHLDLKTENQVAASAAFVQSIWNEYVKDENPVFDKDTILNVGTDEYSGANEGFRSYMDKMFEYVQGTGRTVRAWGSLTSAPGDTPVRVKGVQLNMWFPDYANPKTMYDLGYDLISTRDDPMYIVPGAGYYNDYIDTSARYSDWTPYDSFGGIPVGSPQILGGGFACWNDLVDWSANGLSTLDVYDRIADALPTVAEKTWGEGKAKTYNELRALQGTLGDAPNSNPRMEIKSNGDLIARYRCETTEDASENSYDIGELTNASFEAGGQNGKALRLNGGASSAALPIGTVGPNSIECWVKQDMDASGDQILFESDKGSIKVYANGKVGFTREEYGTLYSGYTFDYTLPKGEWVKLRFSSELGTAKLYVNGTLTSTLTGKQSGGDPMPSTDWYATMYLPLDRIGSKTSAFKGLVDQITVYRGVDEAPADPDLPAEKLTVTFDSNGGSAVTAAAVTAGETLTEPADPTREGYTFGGWYTTFVPVTAWDFTAPVSKSMTLYARWIKGADADAPAAWGPTPTDAQLAYHQEEMAAFVHFGPNTFTDCEWGSGNETAADFSPTNMTQEGVDAWVQALKDAGFKRVMMVGKHHDGFCMWDSQYTDFDVMSSPFKQDVMEMVSKACTKADMGMGFYISPWDMHEQTYGKGDAYNEYYNNQLIEVLSNSKYGNSGKFVEIWMDGAKGAGAVQEYDFDRWFDTIHTYQPDCLIYTDRADGGIRWSGNERGMAGDPCWQRMNVGSQFDNDSQTEIKNALLPWKTDPNRTHGASDGTLWSVCECDVSLRPGWFYHNSEAPKSMEQLAEIYFNSVGLGSVLLLNVPPDKTGNFSDADSARLAEFGRAVTETYARDFVKESGVTATADHVRGSTGKFSADKAIDGSNETYWTMDDGQTTGALTIALGQERTFDMVSIKEYIALGQRISGFKVEYRTGSDGAWKEFAAGTTIGQRRLVRGKPVTADRLRITITASQAVPLISDVGAFKMAAAFEVVSSIPKGLTYIDDREFTRDDKDFQEWGGSADNDGINGTHTGTKNGTFTRTFTGSKFYLIGNVDPGHGKFEVSVDGGAATTVDGYSAQRKIQQVLYTSPDLTQGEHTVTVHALDQKNTSATNTWLDFDGMYVLNNGGKGMFELDKPAYTMAKNDTLEVLVRRVGGSAGEATVQINTLPGTAVQGQYYEEVSGQLTFAEGETEKTVTLKSFQTAVPNDMYFYFAISAPTNDALIGFQPKTTVTISASAAAKPQKPAGDTFTKDDPFVLPNTVGAVKRMEAEYSILQPGKDNKTDYVRVEDGPGENNRHIGWFESGNSIMIPYTAAKAGTYTVTVHMESGRSAGNLNTLNWRGGTVESGAAEVPSTIVSGSATEYRDMQITLTVKQPGYGEIEFYADSQASPNIDYFDFALTAPVVVTYTVTFNSNGGSDVTAAKVNAGDKLTKPADPTRSGYTFKGWYKDTALTETWNFDEDTVNSAMTLYAKWTEETPAPETYTVTFNSNGGSDVTAVTVNAGDKLTKPADPAKDGFTFVGWYQEPDLQTAWNFAEGTVTGDVTLYAKWTANVPSGGNSSGGSHASNTTTSTTTQPNGDTVTTTTNKATGETTVTTTSPEGIKVQTAAKGDIVKNAVVTVPKDAAENGTVELPAELPVSNDQHKAPTVEVKLPQETDAVRVEIPVSGLTAGTVAVLVKPDGSERVIRQSVTEDGKLVVPLDGSATIKIVDKGASFADVPQDSWAADPISYATSRELFNGMGHGRFEPDAVMSRAMLATVLYRYYDEPAPDTEIRFPDVTTDRYYADAVAWTTEQGIVTGANGKYHPDESVTREQLMAMLYRAAGDPASKQGSLGRFADGQTVSAWAQDAAAWAVENGIVNGVSGNRLAPQRAVSRAEVAAMLQRFARL